MLKVVYGALLLTWERRACPSLRIRVKSFSGFSVIRGELGDALSGMVEPERPPWVLPGSISLELHRLAGK